MRSRGLVVVIVALAACCGAMAGCAKKDAGPVDAGAAGALPPGTREIEFLQYNDVTDVYRLFLKGRPNPNEPQRVPFLRLAHLSDDDVKAGKKPVLRVEKGGPVAWLGSGFRIGLLHGFVEERQDPETGAMVHVVTRSEKRWWQPFGGQALLPGADPYAEPAFAYPPPYHPGPITGIGGRGATKDAAAADYARKNGGPPQAVKLRNEGFRSTVGQHVDAGVIAPLDPTTGIDNRIIRTVPGHQPAVPLVKKPGVKKKRHR